MKALLNWRYYVLMVVGMIAVIGTFSVPIDDQPLGAWLAGGPHDGYKFALFHFDTDVIQRPSLYFFRFENLL